MTLRLEIFENQASRTEGQVVVLDSMALEESKLESYDKGYSAGWDDAVAAQQDDQSKVSAELARNLQSLGFTYHEARMHVLKAIRPLIEELIGPFLPELAKNTLGPNVLEVLMPIADTLADAPIKIVLHPNARLAVERVLQGATGLPLEIVEEETLGVGQVFLRIGESETELNMGRAIEQVRIAVQNFFDFPERI
jgi:flagellar assembly protein FliH